MQVLILIGTEYVPYRSRCQIFALLPLPLQWRCMQLSSGSPFLLELGHDCIVEASFWVLIPTKSSSSRFV